jgi:hypothetical protein
MTTGRINQVTEKLSFPIPLLPLFAFSFLPERGKDRQTKVEEGEKNASKPAPFSPGVIC